MAGLLRKLLFCILTCLVCTQCSRAPVEPAAQDALPSGASVGVQAGGEPILPIPGASNLSAPKVALGRQLFHDTILSGPRREASCATCHPLEQGGTRGPAADLAGAQEAYDIPTVFNTAHHFAYFWNGRAPRLEAVIQSSINSANVLNSSWGEILPHLSASEEYQAAFTALYPESGVSESAVEDALVTFLESLATPNAAFDRWLNGESLPQRAQDGYALFKRIGCARCHQGVGAGGNLYAPFSGYVEEKTTIRTADYGRFNVTNDEAHRYQFKVPSLRNVAVTAPYFHDGGVERLDDAVDAMARHQLGRDLTAGEIDLIVAFLESLTGWYDERLLGDTGGQESP